MTKIKLISHNDLDGVSPALLGRLAFGDDNFDYSTVSIGRINDTVTHFIEEENDGDTALYITDISVNEEVAEKLNKLVKKGQKITLIDHHISALPLAEKYHWVHVIAEDENGKKTAATSLFYDYLVRNNMLQKTALLDEYVELVRLFDTWDWFHENNLKAKRLNHLYYLIPHEEFKETILETLRESYHTENQEFTFTDKHEILLEAEEKKIEKYIYDKQKQIIKERVEIDNTAYNAGIVFADTYQSELGNALCLENEDIDFSVMVDMGRQKIGFRAVKDEINLAEIVGHLGGGGHPKASGCKLTAETFALFVTDHLFKDEEKSE
ncbi:phosphoesterase [Priestia aryabhattai]|uniref:DHH family phosphoesterase n=1 Tax=Priestia TaxID=2800373 RepID=UPI001EB91BB6|nr:MULTISPECIES: DHHA1 domain-containing protein [Priestia]MBY0090126.1 phosphoesterase [Priestia aryabhattai]MBY0100284.1 phosphoesterase [Priestia aryabhattai]MCM3303421.1 DHHA1 domain-containing protein [Priestia megaterium]